MFEMIINILMIPVLLVGFTVLGISEAVYSGKKNVSNYEKFEHLISRTFEMKEDMYYFQWSDTKEWSLDNRSSMFPASVKDYERDPENWMNTDANAQEGHGLKDGYGKEKVTGVVKSGTKVTVKKVLLKKSIVNGNSYRIIGMIEDGPFAGCIGEINSMFDIFTLREYETPKIDDKKLKPV